MNYSAGMVSQVFAFVETKQTAELMAAGMSKDEVQDKVIGENLYQLRNENRLRRTFNYVYNRLSSLPDGAVELCLCNRVNILLARYDNPCLTFAGCSKVFHNCLEIEHKLCIICNILTDFIH